MHKISKISNKSHKTSSRAVVHKVDNDYAASSSASRKIRRIPTVANTYSSKNTGETADSSVRPLSDEEDVYPFAGVRNASIHSDPFGGVIYGADSKNVTSDKSACSADGRDNVLCHPAAVQLSASEGEWKNFKYSPAEGNLSDEEELMLFRAVNAPKRKQRTACETSRERKDRSKSDAVLKKIIKDNAIRANQIDKVRDDISALKMRTQGMFTPIQDDDETMIKDLVPVRSSQLAGWTSGIRGKKPEKFVGDKAIISDPTGAAKLGVKELKFIRPKYSAEFTEDLHQSMQMYKTAGEGRINPKPSSSADDSDSSDEETHMDRAMWTKKISGVKKKPMSAVDTNIDIKRR